MSLALVEQLNFEKQMPIDGNCKQQIAISVPSTGAGSYNLGPDKRSQCNRSRCKLVYSKVGSAAC